MLVLKLSLSWVAWFGYRSTSRLGKLIRLGIVILMSCKGRWDCPNPCALVSKRTRVAGYGEPYGDPVLAATCFVTVAWPVPCYCEGSYLVDPASSHMLVSKIKPCMSKYKHLYCETANGSLNQLSFI